jgi:lipoate-protein ligase B
MVAKNIARNLYFFFEIEPCGGAQFELHFIKNCSSAVETKIEAGNKVTASMGEE